MAAHPNADLVRKGFKAFNTGDVATLTEILSSDCVQHMPGQNRFSGDHKGRDSVLAMYGELMTESSGTFSAKLEEVYANDHRAVAIYHATATRGRKKLDERHALCFEIVAGKATDLEDVGLNGVVNDAFWA
jgi:ketosteroid isomerase-like protein